MLIDPFIVIAQLVNFGLLVWLLRRFLYGPVTRVMQAREERVREEVAAARRLRAAADADCERYQALLAGFAAEREARLADVHAEVDALRHEQTRAARAEVKELRKRWHHALAQEKAEFLRELRTHVGRESVAVMRRAFEDLADEDLEDRVVARFVERLRAMGAETRERLVSAAREDGDGFRVSTAFPVTEGHRTALTAVLAEMFEVDGPPRFETNPDLVAGVELSAGGVQVAWTLDDYLDTFEEAMRKVLLDAGGDGIDGTDGTDEAREGRDDGRDGGDGGDRGDG